MQPAYSSGLFTDYYELVMAQGYYIHGWQDKTATFDYFFRKNPFEGGYVLFAGLDDLLEALENYGFNKEACEYLESIGFDPKFINYLKELRFSGTIYSVKEGEMVFPQEVIVRVEGKIIETQLLETLLLNILNFQSLIATKAARIKQSIGEKHFIDFGLRRAQGLGGIHASRAAVIGGADSTSNVYAAKTYNLKVSGTQAHSWIESFNDELEAFRTFASKFPDNTILLVDTYNTLKSGVPNAIKVAKEMEESGHQLLGVRLDSGDLAYLSKKTRKMLDAAGCQYVKIAASNQLDEYIIKSLQEQNAPIDVFGVGTSLVTGRDDAALDGIYKLTEFENTPRIKVSENIEKTLSPGRKKVVRAYDQENRFYADAVALSDEENIGRIIHPFFPDKTSSIKGYKQEELLTPVYVKGKRINDPYDLNAIKEYRTQRMKQLPEEHKRFDNPHVYRVGITEKLMQLRSQLMKEISEKI